jgi:dipeptidyl aminopeptidase/acylaminoacyl peptidase
MSGYEKVTSGPRRDRKELDRRIVVAAVMILAALVSISASACSSRSTERQATEPSSRPPGGPEPPGAQREPRALGIFADVGGWIAYGNAGARYQRGIWAVDPANPGDPKDQIRLSSLQGEPLAWSSDGLRLLLRRWNRTTTSPSGIIVHDLIVLNSDGTRTHLDRKTIVTGGSFSPDGSKVVYAAGNPSGIYTVDAEGGQPRLLLAPGRRYFPLAGRFIRTLLYAPTFSPDGKRIAYFDGLSDSSHTLWVMNADGSNKRLLLETEEIQEARRVGHLAWSPDGTRLAFDILGGPSSGINTVSADGSGLALAIPGGVNPYWSPDGSRISYQISYTTAGTLQIASSDGAPVQEFSYAASGPWNPLDPQT